MPQRTIGELPSRVWDLLRLRCPICGTGRVFAGSVTIRPQCPTCRYVFAREPGYFLGAIAIGYILGVTVTVGLGFLVHAAFPSLDWEWCFGVGLLLYAFFAPMVFRYARTTWMYIDNWFDPPNP